LGFIRVIGDIMGFLKKIGREIGRAGKQAAGIATLGLIGGSSRRDNSAADAHYAAMSAMAARESARLSQEIEKSRQGVNAGISRSSRGRSRGGIFGDVKESGGQPLNRGLG